MIYIPDMGSIFMFVFGFLVIGIELNYLSGFEGNVISYFFCLLS